MRHNQNARHMRGGRRGNNGQSHHNSHGGNHGGGNGGGGNNGGRRFNPRVQIFDSNGPEVRIRGNAIQVNEKYMALARDAASAGDRILAESYFQHAEHYLRMINEANEEFARNNPQQHQQQQSYGSDEQPSIGEAPGRPGSDEALNDLDQGFLTGGSRNKAVDEDAAASEQPRQPRSQPRTTETG